MNLSSSPPLSDNVRTQADHRFQEIMERFRDRDPDRSSKYDRPKLVGLVYRYSISQKSKDNILRAVFRALELPMEGDAVDFSTETALLLRLIGFADHLVNNFFMPCTLKRSHNRVCAFTCLVLTDSVTVRASTAKTPQPTPHYRSATLRSSSKDFVGTPERLSTLRGDCLVRDKHRCVISRAYDKTRAENQAAADVMLDDDQRPIKDGKFAYLEVAHIMPHSLVQVGSDSEELVSHRCPFSLLEHLYRPSTVFYDFGIIAAIDVVGFEVDAVILVTANIVELFSFRFSAIRYSIFPCSVLTGFLIRMKQGKPP